MTYSYAKFGAKKRTTTRVMAKSWVAERGQNLVKKAFSGLFDPPVMCEDSDAVSGNFMYVNYSLVAVLPVKLNTLICMV